MHPIINALTFLINTLADLYVFVLIARIILSFAHANTFNPMMRLIAQLTNPLVLKIKRYLPDVHGIELSSCSLIFGIELIKFLLLCALSFTLPNFFGLLILVIAEVLKLTINVFFYAILLQVILSWLPYSYNEVYSLLAYITAPVMTPIRRLMPPVKGFDLTPIPALICLQLIIILIIDPIFSLGIRLTFG